MALISWARSRQVPLGLVPYPTLVILRILVMQWLVRKGGTRRPVHGVGTLPTYLPTVRISVEHALHVDIHTERYQTGIGVGCSFN